MSIEALRKCFIEATKCTDWSLQLLKITASKDGAKYSSCQITLSPSDKLSELVKSLSTKYSGSGKGSLSSFSALQDYNGSADGMTIYKLTSDSELISDEYSRLMDALATPDVEVEPYKYTSAYVISGEVELDGVSAPVKLISIQNPITTLKHKFSLESKQNFKEIDKPILTLRNSVDVVIVDGIIYFLTLAGENLFNMARAYKAVCHSAVVTIEKAGFISEFDSFRTVAESGHNPRRFVSYDPSIVTALKNTNRRKAIAEKFSIPLDKENHFDASADGAAEKIVKLLCRKGMLDPIENNPVEVSNARQWQ